MGEAAEDPDYNRSSNLLFFGYGQQFCLEIYSLLATPLISSTSALPAGNTPSVSVSCADPDKAMAN